MTRSEIIPLLHALGIHPSKKLGQNFLVDSNLLDAMVRDATPQAGERVLEVGPGLGALTRRLLSAGCHVTAVEIDYRLAEFLREDLAGEERFRLIRGDACQVDYEATMGSAPFRVIANLPYACSSVLLAQLVRLPNPPTEMIVLLQREMAERLIALPQTKAYGALSVAIRLHYDVVPLRRIPPDVFFPAPQVDSMQIRIAQSANALNGQQLMHAAAVARIGFSQRRKQIAKLLSKHVPREHVLEALSHLGLPEDCRAEDLPPETFHRLAERLPEISTS
ncbi:MAG: ribosomal RNA small subunit methyltransferase A [Lentisphaerae bacterium]|jgi:16S rRNA (adenine1518-N6/adenine1519-N6)-dimethyltransferase|nr:ribosomal RNA small subunit methyltransferase A [Lentisphaerota bacterium]MBT4822026.1 ribosomal RNA small subunit methyltransferase A [Lentisphaerota bacterium]MBT5610030.1 ribosomal RNA small subunit methyltransferase A [Lentisphaerota bacterium]MBT7055570.1 ribosomal RNA small subunit methyltransferase A [Lentisphaerota bacterium]MBT7841475.1 ribosomal RNA small subunit methyltransferase A [Lentisphaerota bacterium]